MYFDIALHEQKLFCLKMGWAWYTFEDVHVKIS